MNSYTSNTGKIYSLVPEYFAKGGEGEIYEIIGLNSHVAKIYYEKNRTSLREEKIMTMIRKPPDAKVINQFTWPVEILYENKKFAGYIMPRLRNNYKLNTMYEYPRSSDKPWNLYITIAKNLAAAINGVHISGHICGDLNPNNICVNPVNGIITLVDTDSYHIYDDETDMTYKCVVAMEPFIPRELQNVNLSTAPLPTFTKETDLFTLAILIFSLLMNGCHPFACSNTMASGSVNKPSYNIIEGIFPFMTKNNHIGIPRYAPPIDILGRKIKGLFKRAFVTGYKKPNKRPTAADWYYALTDLEKSITVCENDKSHIYYKKLNKCPWCKINSNMMILNSKTFVQPAKILKKSNLIHEQKSVFKLLDINIFESSRKSIPAQKFRVYSIEFVYKKIRCMYIQLNFTHNLHNAVNININYNIINEAGDIIAEESKQVSIDMTAFNHTIMIDYNYDKLETGKYQIQVNIDNSNIINKDIEIIKRAKISIFQIKNKISFAFSMILWIWSAIIAALTGIPAVLPIITLCFDFILQDLKYKIISKSISGIMCIILSLFIILLKFM